MAWLLKCSSINKFNLKLRMGVKRQTVVVEKPRNKRKRSYLLKTSQRTSLFCFIAILSVLNTSFGLVV